MKKYIAMALCFVCLVQAKIVDIYSIREMDKYLFKEDCLVIFDIDNTLLEPTQDIGSDQWFEHRIKILKQSGLDDCKAFKKAYDEWHRVQAIIDFKLVEQSTKEVLDKVKSKFKTMALTTRGFQISYETMQALESLGVNFDKEPYISDDIFFKTEDKNPIISGVYYTKGILFTNNAHKGEALFTLLDLAGKKSKNIVFINDKRSHLEQVQESSDKRKISFVGLRYGFNDDKVKGFNPTIAKWDSIKLSKFFQVKE